MKRALYAVLFVTLASTSSQASFALGQVNLSSGSGQVGSLGTMGTGAGSTFVGTNLSAPSATPLGLIPGSPVPLGGFFDFTTGAYAGTDGSGNTLYAAGGNFFVLTGTLADAAGTSPVSSSLTTGLATVSSLGGGEFNLTMGFTGGYLSQTVANDFGLPYVALPDGRIYSGTLSFVFIVDPTQAGNQLLSGSITFNTVPEPSSFAMLFIGGLGLMGYGRRRFQRSAA